MEKVQFADLPDWTASLLYADDVLLVAFIRPKPLVGVSSSRSGAMLPWDFLLLQRGGGSLSIWDQSVGVLRWMQ